ncbi:unnamed protein product [Discula destructiva]
MQPRKSLDLLQAIVILVAWFHSGNQSFQLTNLLFLMRSICVSLGFNESQAVAKHTESPSLEYMRAFTGVYYLVTMVFTTAKKADAFMNTTYIDHCCQILEDSLEYPSDRLLVLLVRTQQLSQSISTTLAFRNHTDSLPLSLVVQSFRHQIRQLKETISKNLCDSVTLNTQVYISEILLYEAAISEELSTGSSPIDRLGLLWQCLIAVKTMLEVRFNNLLTDGWPRYTGFDYTFAMLVGLKLSLLQLPGWDLRTVRKEFDFDKYLRLQIQEFKDFTAARNQPHAAHNRETGATNDAPQRPPYFQDPYVRLYNNLSQMRACILPVLAAVLPPVAGQTKQAEEARQNEALDSLETGTSDSGLEPGETFSDGIPGLDDVFWQDMYNSHDWETSFSTILEWGLGEATGPAHTN